MQKSFVSSALRLVAVAGVALVPLAAAAVPASATAGNATVTVVHGIPDTAVDVYVDGAKALPNFKFKTVTPPYLAAGRLPRHRGPPGGRLGQLQPDPEGQRGAESRRERDDCGQPHRRREAGP